MIELGPAVLYNGWGHDVLPGMAADSVDSVVCDPPYGLSKEPDIAEVLRHWLAGDDYKHTGAGFMGKSWDSFVPGPATWKEVYRVLKPGGHLLCFAGSRTVDLMGISLRMAGFEIRDQIQWVYGSGFPKSLDVSKALDKAAGAEREVLGGRPWTNAKMDAGNGVSGLRQTGGFAGEYESERVTVPVTAPATDAAKQWAGWGTALKPAHEPIIVARKPLIGTVAANVLQFGTGALNIDGCRVETNEVSTADQYEYTGDNGNSMGAASTRLRRNGGGAQSSLGRFPANLIHDGSDEVLACFPQAPGQLAKAAEGGDRRKDQNCYGVMARGSNGAEPRIELDQSAARFFYAAKASKADRGEGNGHPTVKPQALMRYLCRLVTPPGGTVLDSFAGSGSTGVAAVAEGFRPILIEQDPDHFNLCCARVAMAIMEGV